MNILFVTFGSLSLSGGASRSVSFLQALASSGNQVDVIASGVDICIPSNVKVLLGASSCAGRAVRLKVLGVLRSASYDAVHVVDDAVFFVSRIARLSKIPVIYEASRCFSGKKGSGFSLYKRLFPRSYCSQEKRLLESCSLVFSHCGKLTADLRNIASNCLLEEIVDVPLQSLCAQEGGSPSLVSEDFPECEAISKIVVFRVVRRDRGGIKKLLLAARKVVDRDSGVVFYFSGRRMGDMLSMADNLDVQSNCCFLSEDDPARYLSVLSLADVALFVPAADVHYPHADVITMLNSSAVVISISNSACSVLLSEENSIAVDYTATSIAERILQVVKEPLLVRELVSNALQQVADYHSFSSFKHKVRMAYKNLSTQK